MGRILGRNDTTGPGGTKPPILLAERREKGVVLRRVGKVANVKKNLIEVFRGPLLVKLRNNSRGIDMIPVMEVVVIVIT